MEKKTEAPRGEVAAYTAPDRQYGEVLDLKDRLLHLYPVPADSRASVHNDVPFISELN